MPRHVNILKSIDWITVIFYLLLVIMGWLNIYAAVYNQDHQNIFDITQRYGKQMLWIILAITFATIFFLLDSKIYSFFAYIIYILIILSLISVLLFGKEVHGARSWFEIGDFRLQPAEFGKFATCLAVAKLLSTENIQVNKLSTILLLAIILGLPFGLIILQNDTGSALIYGAFLIVLYREGLPGWILLILILLAILFIMSLVISMASVLLILIGITFIIDLFYQQKIKNTGVALSVFVGFFAIIGGINEIMVLNISLYYILLFCLSASGIIYTILAFRYHLTHIYIILLILAGAISFNYSVDYIFNQVLEAHHQTRIKVLLGVETDIKDAGYNVHQSKIAIGSGGVYGKGFLQGTQTKFDFVPEQSTDFIFCTVGEEWGFVGTSAVIILFLIFLLRLIFLAERQRSAFSRIYGYGVIAIFFFHIIINIGMTIGLAPVIGIPLPFFSYGGSSLWSFTILLFIFIRLDASRSELL